ncbi:MAG: tetratricopeptide repeat protein [Bacteroidales bacterium]|nr:tetratricopeptide repeat protein [Bacteroidales bacterium]
MRSFVIIITILFSLSCNAQDDSIVELYRAGNYKKVVQIAKELDLHDSLHWEILYAVGVSHIQVYDFEKAILYLTKALEKNHNGIIIRSLASCYESKGDSKRAILTYEECLKLDSFQVFCRAQLAQLLEDQGRLTEAYENYKKLINYDSTNFYFLRQAAKCCKKMDNIDLAIEWYKKELMINPADIASAAVLINMLIGQKHLDTAEVYANISYAYDTCDVRIIKQKAYLLYLKEDYEQSIEWFKKAVYHNDSSKFSFKYLGLANFKNSYYDTAIIYLNKAYMQDTTDAEILFFIGNSFGKLLQEEMAIVYLEKARQIIMPSKDVMISVYGKLGEMHNAVGEYNLALVDYLTPHGFYPDEPEMIFYIAVQYDYMANFSKALKYYERFLSIAKPDYDMEIPDGMTISYRAYATERIRVIKEELFFKGEETEN